MDEQRIVVAVSPRNVNAPKLFAEGTALWANLHSLTDLDVAIGFDFDGAPPAQAAVNALVAAHDPTPIKSPEQLAFEADRQAVRDYVTDAGLDAFLINVAPLPAAQLAAFKATIRAVRALARASQYAVNQLK